MTSPAAKKIAFAPRFALGEVITNARKDGSDADTLKPYVVVGHVLAYMVEGENMMTAPGWFVDPPEGTDTLFELVHFVKPRCTHMAPDGKLSYTDPVCRELGYEFCPRCGEPLYVDADTSHSPAQ